MASSFTSTRPSSVVCSSNSSSVAVGTTVMVPPTHPFDFLRSAKSGTEMTQQILLVNGPNLNLLGTREPALYGHETLDDVVRLTTTVATELGLAVRAVQSNHEGVLIDAIHEARRDCAAVIVNLGALTHTSIALRDALTGISLPIA